ncbi:MAG TPA: glutamate synthase subunit alpha, partial [Anaerolineae bacterium]|nr:glutamate synthase subunit alpha [Anaerolineae bacterium]
EDVRRVLAQLGFHSLSEVIGRTELLEQVKTGVPAVDTLDLSPLLAKEIEDAPTKFVEKAAESHALTKVNELNELLLTKGKPAIEQGEPVQLNLPISNTDRTVGATLAGAIAKQYGDKGLPDGTINITFNGSAGQSFGAYTVPGMSMTLIGEANDYVGKNMKGGQIVVRPPLKSQLSAHDNVIIGNTVLYGATGGNLFAAGQAGERFAVRNSGATAVVEGVGDHGCEYMTSGVVVVLGRTGYNFGAGMSGGMAFVLDEANRFTQRFNPDMIQVVRLTNQADVDLLRLLITRHVRLTGSEYAQAILDDWSVRLGLFWKIGPKGTIGASGKRLDIKVTLPMPQEMSQHVAA